MVDGEVSDICLENEHILFIVPSHMSKEVLYISVI